ncbi:MAG TPA: hypothetical protein VIW29_18050 [Polyangiaceae bacterium]
MRRIQEKLMMTKSFALIGFALAAVGCGGAIRTAEPYRDDVAKVLESKNADVKACYDNVLKSDKTKSGQVTVHFKVEAETGAFKDITADGPPELGACVSSALSGLVLAPADVNNGDATFVYEFTVGPPAAS